MSTSFNTAKKSEVRGQKSATSVLSPQSSVLHCPLPTADCRLNRHRGSILIMVVALLVMLALIGTAFLSSSRSDKAAAAQSTSNSQLDLVAQGVSDMATNSIVNALYDKSSATSSYRNPMALIPPAAPPVTPGTAYYHNFTAPDVDWYLASRIPVNPNPATAISTTNLPRWDWISTSPTGVFEDPVTGVQWGNFIANTAPDRSGALITSLAVNGTVLPALQVATAGHVSSGKANGSLPPGIFVAGDADGDGIADCGLFPIGTVPGAQFSGLKFYAGIRVVDGNSAINASTAWTFNNDADFSGGVGNEPGVATATLRNNRLNPASIGLREMMPGPTAASEFDYPTGINTNKTLVYTRQNGVTPWSILTTPAYGDFSPGSTTLAPTARNDYGFISQLDVFWTQMGARLNFPGFINTTTTRYRSFDEGDTAALAHRFCLRDPNGSVSQLEQCLPTSLNSSTNSQNTPYSASKFDTWFNTYFNYPATGGITAFSPAVPGGPYTPTGQAPGISLRPLLVARNPVSNLAPRRLLFPAALPDYVARPADYAIYNSASTYNVDDTVVGSDGRCYRAITSVPVNKPAPNATYWKQLRTFMTSVTNGVYNSAATYQVGDVVLYSPSTSSPPADNYNFYVAIQAVPASTPPVTTASPPVYNAAYWQYLPWTTAPAKVNVNKAPFADLWQAYWNVMAANVTGTPAAPVIYTPFQQTVNQNANSASDTHTGVFEGNHFNNAYPFGPTANDYHFQRMFRSSIRDSSRSAYAQEDQQLLLRAAIAAVNTEQLRQRSLMIRPNGVEQIITHAIPFHVMGATPPVVADTAVVYGQGIQPYIAEIYYNNNKADMTAAGLGLNPNGYMAIVLHNPYEVDISLDNIVLATENSFGPPKSITAFKTFNPGTLDEFNQPAIIPAKGFVVLENFPGDATYRPSSAKITASAGGVTRYVSVTNLPSSVDGKQFVILRPHQGNMNAAGTQITYAYTGTTVNIPLVGGGGSYRYNDGTPGTPPIPNPEQMVPCDAFNFEATATYPFVPEVPADPANGVSYVAPTAFIFHYMRETDSWKFVYPGRYDGANEPYQEGFIIYDTDPANQWHPQTGNDPANPTPLDNDPWQNGPPAATTHAWGPAVNLSPTAAGNASSTYPGDVFTIQLNNEGFGGPNSISSTLPNHYPLGGFMREGDILQVPFIGSYKILALANATNYVELNPVTVDAAFAEDTDQNDNAEENIGRFCPIIRPNTITNVNDVIQHPLEYNYTAPSATGAGGIASPIHYAWAGRLFDYLTVRDPIDQSFPDAEAGIYKTYSNTPTGTNSAPQPVPTTPSTVTENSSISGQPITPQTHSDVGIDGLINVNTAPYPVLAAVPWATEPGFTAADLTANAQIAQAIVTWRLANGPFHNLFELNRVISGTTSLRTRYGTWAATENNSTPAGATFTAAGFKDNARGDFSPVSTVAGNPPQWNPSANGTADGVINDFESQYLMMTRLSNMLTTRSDTFTVYVVIEGWENAGVVVGGVPQAKRVIQQRRAFLVDRTNVTPFNRVPRITPIPTN